MYNDNNDSLYLSQKEFVSSIKAKGRIEAEKLREQFKQEKKTFIFSNREYVTK